MDENKRKVFIEKAEMLGSSIQVELFKFSKEFLIPKLGDSFASDMAAAIANWVFHFGLIAPAHEKSEELMKRFTSDRRAVFGALGQKFKTNATGVLILLGAAWALELSKFEHHIKDLASENFAQVGKETPDVSGELSKDDLVYLNTVVSITLPPHVLIDHALSLLEGKKQLVDAESYLISALEKNRFRTERAIEVFKIAIDNAVWASMKEAPNRRSLYREYKLSDSGIIRARELTERLKTEMGIEN
jgi:hypothetical protein